MRKTILSTISTVALTGCATLPNAALDERVTSTEILSVVRCEISAVTRSSTFNSKLANWLAPVTLERNVNDTTSVSPGITAKADLGGGAKLNIPTSATFESAISRQIQYKDNLVLGAIDPSKCPAEGSASAARGLDLREWMIAATSNADTSADKLQQITYDAKFTVTRSAGGGLVFESEHFSVALNANSASRANLIHLSVVVGPPPPPAPKGGKAKGATQDKFDALRDKAKEQQVTNQLFDLLTNRPGL